MDERERTRISKFLSYVLRHRPDAAGLELDAAGWAEVDALLSGCRNAGYQISRSDLDEVVETNSKRRFALSDDGTRIRANQGHSTEVELGYEPSAPPDTLFHGTVGAALGAIRKEGLKPMSRHDVHLSVDVETAINVGGRRGKPVVLEVDAAAMHEAGHVFYRTPNDVWLTDAVDPRYIRFPSDS